MQELCGFVAGTTAAELPSAVTERARAVLIDTAGVIVGGSRSRQVSALSAGLAQTVGLGAACSCFGQAGFQAPALAALVNGVAGSSLEFDEGNSKARGHPAIQVVPAAAAVCEARGLTGADLVGGLVFGYEVAARLGQAARLRRGLHPTGSWGLVGSAVGAARALGRSGEDLAELANLASSYCLSTFVRNSFRGFSAAATFAGLVNHLAVLANTLFEAGFRADPGSLEVAFTRFVSEGLDGGLLGAGLGKEYAICAGYLKPYPACRFTQPALDALRALLASAPVAPEDVEAIAVETFEAAAHGSDRRPENVDAMRFSIPYLAAALVRCGEARGEGFDEDLLRDPAVEALARRVTVTARPDYEALRPTRHPARVELRLADGRQLSTEVMNAAGDPELPLSEAQIREKFLGLAEPALGRERSRLFLELASGLERLADVRPLFACLRPGP
jgi:2-methylcitrate dehydratase PrpD